MTDYRTRLGRYIAGDYVAEIWPEETFGDVKPSDNVKADLRSLLSEADRLRALVDEAGKVVEPLVTFLSDADDLQNRPDRGDWGVECALCMGELVEDSEKRTLEAARSLLTKLKGEGQ